MAHDFLGEELAAELLEAVLLADRDVPSLANHYGITRRVIYRLLAGRTYAHVRPDLPRRKNVLPPKNRVTCNYCAHYTGDSRRPCQLDFPEANGWKISPPSRGRRRVERAGNSRVATDCPAFLDSLEVKHQLEVVH